VNLRFYDDTPQPAFPSIFLAGPTSRTGTRTPWRAEAVALFRAAGFSDELVLPEFRDRTFRHEYFEDHQPSTVPGMRRVSQRILEWETNCIDAATVLLVWMPFSISDDDASLPGFTTRAEVARAIAQRRPRLQLGMPKGAVSGGHIRFHAHHAGYPIADTLKACIEGALLLLP
jgi:hypothetical protein